MTIFMQNVLAMSSSSSATQSYWIATLGGTGSDVGYCGTIDSAGNSYVAGPITSQGAGSNDIFVAKYNSSGAIQWQRILGGTASDEVYGICTDSSNNVYVTGYTASQSVGGNDAFIAKYDTDGALQWQRSIGGSVSDIGWAVTCSSTGDVYLVGQTASQGVGSNDALIVKYNSSGTLQWQRSLGGSGDDVARGAGTDSSGNLYIVGFTASQGAGNYDAFIAKYNSSGTIQWQRSLGGGVADAGLGVAVSSSGNVYVSGYTNSQGAGNSDALIAKYDTNGTIQWQRSLGGSGNEEALGVCVDSSENVYITGYTTSQGMGSNDAFIAKYNSSGTIEWQRTFGGNGTEITYSVSADSSGCVFVFGFTMSAGSGSHDLLVAKLPADGSLTGSYGYFTYRVSTLTDAARTLTSATRTLTDSARTLTGATRTLTSATATLTSTTQNLVPAPSFWISTLGGSSADGAWETAVGPSGNVYVAGYSNSTGNAAGDALLVKYNPAGAVQWQKTLAGSSLDWFMSIALDSSENIYTAGITSSQGAGSYDGLLCKYNSDGDLQWQRSLGGSGDDRFRRVTADSSGNVYVTGWTASQGAGGDDLLIVKYNSSGTLQWQRSLGGASNDYGYGIGTDASGNVYVVGQTASQGAGVNDSLIVKYNSSGVLQWQRSLGGAGNEEPLCAVDSSGNVYLCGITSSQGAGGEDILIAKYNSSGVIQWQRSLGGTGTDQGRSIAVDAMSNIYIAGTSNSAGGAGGYDIVIAKYSTSGAIQWQRSLGGTGNDYAQSVAIDSSTGALYVAGWTASAGAGSDDLLLVKLPADGSLTGTYGSFTYQARTLTDATRTLTDATRTLTDAARTLTDSARTLTTGTASLTANKTTVQ